MATTYRNKTSKFWYARFTDGTGKRISRTTKTESRREAKRIAADMESQSRREVKREPDREGMQLAAHRIFRAAELDLEGGTLTSSRAAELMRQLIEVTEPTTKPSFRKFAGDWLDDIERQRGGALRSSLNALQHVQGILGDKAEIPIDKITRVDIEGIQAGLKAKGLRGRTANMYLGFVRRVFAAAVDQGLIATNPAAAVRNATQNDSRHRAPFSADEITRMVEAAPSDEWRGIIILGATSGLRAGDLRKLSSSHIQGGAIKIQPSKTQGSTGTLLTIPLHPQAAEWIGQREGILFPEIAALKPQRVSHVFSKTMHAAGVPARIELAPSIFAIRSMHSLRHTFATMLADAGVAEDVRRKLTGHAGSAMHARYSHHEVALVSAIGSLPKI